eukprot:Gb_09908 [translate_table: standard]
MSHQYILNSNVDGSCERAGNTLTHPWPNTPIDLDSLAATTRLQANSEVPPMVFHPVDFTRSPMSYREYDGRINTSFYQKVGLILLSMQIYREFDGRIDPSSRERSWSFRDKHDKHQEQGKKTQHLSVDSPDICRRRLSESIGSVQVSKHYCLKNENVQIIIFIADGLAIAFVIMVTMRRCWRKYKNGKPQRELQRAFKEFAGRPRKFKLKDLRKATDNFHVDRRLGHGGCGEVYKGILPKDKTPVAVKKKLLSRSGQLGEKELIEEAKIVSRLRHRNLLPLVGWCIEKNEVILVYDLMPNGSLDKLIFNRREGEPVLEWNRRYRIVCGVASALLYLHEECEETIVHRDLKAGNVLLDCNYESRLADFGLARSIQQGKSSYEVSAIAGTVGYLAPECSVSGKATTQSDIFSLGALVLEVACGRPPMVIGESHLVDLVWRLYGEGNDNYVINTADPRLGGLFDHEEMKRLLLLGLACCHPHPHERPTIRQVCEILAKKAAPPFVPMRRPPTGFTPPSSSILQIVT